MTGAFFTCRDATYGCILGIAFIASLGCSPASARVDWESDPVPSSSLPGKVAPLSYERSLPIPEVPIWPYSDSLAIDLKRNRIFATPQGAKMVVALDLETGRVIKTMPSVGNPHAIVFDEVHNRLLVVDGADDSVKVFDGKTLNPIKSISLPAGADMAAYDPRSQTFYVNSSGRSSRSTQSIVSAIDTNALVVSGTIQVNSAALEGAVVDAERETLYVSLPKEFAIAVVDLKRRVVKGKLLLPSGQRSPWVMAIDARRERLYVATRDATSGTAMKGSLVVLDLRDGRIITSLQVGGWADGIYIDEKRSRVYVSSGVGRIDTFEVAREGSVRRLEAVETTLLAKTSLFSPQHDRLYITAPNLGFAGAQIMVYKPSP